MNNKEMISLIDSKLKKLKLPCLKNCIVDFVNAANCLNIVSDDTLEKFKTEFDCYKTSNLKNVFSAFQTIPENSEKWETMLKACLNLQLATLLSHEASCIEFENETEDDSNVIYLKKRGKGN